MAKRKLDVAKLLAAGEDAHLQTEVKRETNAPAANIDGEVFLKIPVADIINNPMQARISIKEEGIISLAESIKINGLIQPISIVKLKDSSFVLKAGQRRWLAHKLLRKSHIKAIVEISEDDDVETYERRFFELSAVENIERDKLDPLELELIIRKALDKNLYKSLTEVASVLIKSKSYLTKIMKVLTLEEEVLIDLTKNKSTNDIESLYELQKLEDKEKQIKLYFELVQGKIDRAEVRRLCKLKKATPVKEKFNIKKTKRKISLNVDTIDLTEDEKTNLEKELSIIINKYVK